MDPALKRDLEKALLRSEDEEVMSRNDPVVVQNLLQMRLKYEKVAKAYEDTIPSSTAQQTSGVSRDTAASSSPTTPILERAPPPPPGPPPAAASTPTQSKRASNKMRGTVEEDTETTQSREPPKLGRYMANLSDQDRATWYYTVRRLLIFKKWQDDRPSNHRDFANYLMDEMEGDANAAEASVQQAIMPGPLLQENIEHFLARTGIRPIPAAAEPEPQTAQPTSKSDTQPAKEEPDVGSRSSGSTGAFDPAGADRDFRTQGDTRLPPAPAPGKRACGMCRNILTKLGLIVLSADTLGPLWHVECIPEAVVFFEGHAPHR